MKLAPLVALLAFSLTAHAAEPKTLYCKAFTQSADGQNDKTTVEAKLELRAGHPLNGDSYGVKKDFALAGGRFRISAFGYQPAASSRIPYESVSIYLLDKEKDIAVQSGVDALNLPIEQDAGSTSLVYTLDQAHRGHPFVLITCELR